MSFWHRGHFATLKEIVADGAGVGTFSYPGRDTIHAYVELGGTPWDPTTVPYMACGINGLIMYRRHQPKTMDRHGTSAVTCGRCRRVLGEVLEAA